MMRAELLTLCSIKGRRGATGAAGSTAQLQDPGMGRLEEKGGGKTPFRPGTATHGRQHRRRGRTAATGTLNAEARDAQKDEIPQRRAEEPQPIKIIYETSWMESSSALPYDENDGNGNAQKKKRRFFDEKTRNACWNKADVLQGRHPERWRKDSAGNTLCRKFLNCQGCLCYEYDHIIPFSRGGETDADNCQILQSRVNRSKGNNEALDNNDLGRFSCDLKFTDKELDIIEMAVYGNVIRPGHQCHCKTVAEMRGEHKSKSPQIACELPYQEKY